MTLTTGPETALAASLRTDGRVLVDRLTIDRAFVARLLLEEDIVGALAAEGFELSERQLQFAHTAVKKIRTYINDQVHVLDSKYDEDDGPKMIESGNGWADW